MRAIKSFIISIALTLTLITGVSAEFFSDIIVTSTDGIWTDSRAYSSLTDAVNAVGSTKQRTIVISSQLSVGDITIPSNITLKFERDGAIINSGQLTLNTRNIIAENRQIFAGAGDIDFTAGTVLKSGWFSTFERAALVTADDSVTLIITKPQTLTTTVALGDNVTLKWDGPGNILTANAGVDIQNIYNIDAGDFQLFAGAGDFDFTDGMSLKLSWFIRLRSALTYIGSDKVTLNVTRPSTVDFTDTVPSNISLYINHGAPVTCTGHVLTINGPLLSTGPYQQFVAVAGEVVFSDTSYVNAAWFGFAESASAAANSAALLAAVTAGNTCINSGTFLLSVQVEIPSNRRVYGAGIGSSILKIPDNVSAGTVATLSPLTTANGGSDILIENLTIDGNRANQSWTPVGSANYGLSVRSSNTVVRNCEFKNVTANGTGVPVTASNVIFDGVISHGNGKKGLHSGDVNKITIINGFYYDNEIDSGIGLHQGATEVIVANNQCYDNGTYGIDVGASTGAYEVSRNVAITGNIIFGNNVGIYLVNNSTSDIEKDLGVSIIGNTIKGNGQGIQTTAAYGFTIADNIIKENDIYGIWINTNSTRYIINGNIIYNNCLTDTSKAAVTLQAGTSNGIVRGNYLYDNQDSATQVRGILIGGTVTGTVVADNHIENATTVAIDDYSSIGVNTVQNNIRINSGSAENNVFSGHTIIRNVTSVTRTGTTDETDLMAAATILAKKMDSVNGVRFTAWGRNTGAAGTKTIKFYWGATAYTVHPADNNASEWRLDVEIQNGSFSSQRIWLLMRTGGIITFDDYTTASVVTTEAVSVKLTGQLSDGSDSISQYRLWGEYF